VRFQLPHELEGCGVLTHPDPEKHLGEGSRIRKSSSLRTLMYSEMAIPLRFPAAVSAPVILILDDTKQVRFFVRAVLESAGYNVIEAALESEALAACEQSELRIDLFISDVLLGEAYGTEVAMRLAALRPHMPILFISGYPIEDVPNCSLRASNEMAVIEFLQKPFNPDQLLAKVRDLVPVARQAGA
jgi:DNA-binding NtrC family response regulator